MPFTPVNFIQGLKDVGAKHLVSDYQDFVNKSAGDPDVTQHWVEKHMAIPEQAFNAAHAYAQKMRSLPTKGEAAVQSLQSAVPDRVTFPGQY